MLCGAVRMCNIRSLSGREGEVCEELRNLMIDVLFTGGEMESMGC